MADLSRALAVAIEAAGAARALLLAECARAGGPRGDIGHCPADDEAEWLIRKRLLAAFPAWGFLGEETGSQAAATKGDGEQPVWIVDPNDGTTSMQRGYRGHAVSIAAVHEGEPVLGVVWAVDAPDDAGDLIAWAAGCGPVQRNGVAVPEMPRRQDGQLGPQDTFCMSQGAGRNPVGAFACVAPARFVAVPSIAYRLALVAVGECVATMSVNPTQAWDHAAGHALVRGVGGVLTDERGQQITYSPAGHSQSRCVFGGNPQVVATLLGQPWQRMAGSGFGDAAPPPSLAPVRALPGRLVHTPHVLSRAQGCLLGQIAGDALGALVEFESADSIARTYPDGGPRQLAHGGPHHILAGQPTDDSELALMLARSLIARGGFDQEAVAQMYARWYHGWTHTDDPQPCHHRFCQPFDVGNTIAQALGAISLADARAGCAASSAAAAASRQSQANGALMRISPLGIWGAFREAQEVATAARQDAQLTHPHPVCQAASEVFAVSIAAAIGGGLDAQHTYACALAWSRSAEVDPAVHQALQAAATHTPADFSTQQGWVLIAFQNAFFQLLHAESVEDGVVATVRAGGDTDTNAAICGALLGAVHGRDAIPEQWQRMVLTCRPMPGQPNVEQPRPALFWATDIMVLAERLVLLDRG